MSQNIDFNKLLPATLKNETLTSLVSNLFNRFVSQEDTLQVSGRIGLPSDNDPQIKQPNLERQENALIPGLFFSSGKEKFIFTFEDFINKMEVLNIDIKDLRAWIAEQSFNYSPPINYDKFINYSNYYWIGKALGNAGPSWNQNSDPEFYVIARPNPDDQIKMPVRLATTRNINRWINDRPPEVFTLTFTSQTTFTIQSNIGTVYTDVTSIPTTAGAQTKITVKAADSNTTAPAISAPGLPDYSICEFYIVNGNNPFSIGDVIQISVTHFTGETIISVNSPNLIGKGTVNGVNTLSPFMYIDGVQVESGDRILVKNQNDPSENGIYIVVKGEEWHRTADALYDSNFPLGMTVYVTEGNMQANKTFVLQTKTQLPNPPADGSINADLTFVLNVSNPPIPVNEWQIYNYWVHRDDLYQFAELGVSINNVTQANRPIIEYSNRLSLNSAVDGQGNPTSLAASDAISITQTKIRFNQIPQFDLYRYDGTHSGSTSGIWYYIEDPNYTTDGILHRRVKTTSNGDYVFGCAAVDNIGRLLYYKIDGALRSIWAAGVSTPTASTPLFFGGNINSAGTIQFNSISPTADNQQWTITFISTTTAEIVGTRSGLVGIATVGSMFTCDDFEITVHAGTISYAVEDKFTFNIYAPSSPRYVKEENGSIINYPGGFTADQALPEPIGTWLTPRRMFQNMYRETREEVSFGNFLNHARSVIRWQDKFTGASFGNNNVRNLQFNPGLGGSIKEFSSNFPLLSSMLIESDMSPITIITFAEQQYNVALSSIDQFLINELAGYLVDGGNIETSVINPNSQDILALEEYFESLRGQDVNLTQVFGDTTAKVKNWPTTLPMLGLVKRVPPTVVLDPELNIYVILHHDGHVSPLAIKDLQFNNNLAKTKVTRSDGTSSAAIFSENTPATPRPYARQLWYKPSTGDLFVFDVRFDTNTTPSGANNGDFWYQRSTNSLFTWNSGLTSWVPAVVSVASRWIVFSPENIRNSLVLAVEKKLFDSVHPAQQINFDVIARVTSVPQSEQYSEIELAAFAAKYGYDIYGPDYDPSNAFTWNYSQGTFLVSIPAGANKARWYSLYQAYFGSISGVIATDRPDLFPWKLGTLAFPASQDKPSGWDAAYKNTVIATTNTVNVKAISTSAIPTPLTGLMTVDGVALQNGDRVLLINQAGPQFNGIYVVSTGGWTRSTDTLVTGLTINVQEGTRLAGTVWVLTTSGSITVNTTPLSFQQSRVWSSQMWTDISAAHPGIHLCVNTATDALLPPYVNASSYYAGNALTNTIPTGVNLGYSFDDRGPIELVWSKSLEFLYGLARTAFRLFPLEFLDKSWGETYIKSGNNLRTERNLMTSLPAQKFLMHGERLNIINTYGPADVIKRIKGAPGTITWDSDFGGKVTFRVTHTANTGDVGADISAYNLSTPLTSAGYMGPSSTVLEAWIDNTFIGFVFEGVPFSFNTMGIAFTNMIIEDLGIPYDMGDAIQIQFTPDTVTTEIPTSGTDFVYGILGCEGCVADAAVDPSQVVTTVTHQPTYSFVPGQVKIFKGLGQWFTNLMRFSNIDTDISISSLAYRGWTINLVHRLGALVRPDSLTITAAAGEVPTTGYNVLLKRSSNTKNLWISALRVQLVQMGARELNQHNLFIPKNDASDWIFRIEVYNTNHPIAEYNILNTSSTFTDFYALNKKNTDVSWKRYNEITGTSVVTMPLQITGLQNVLNFIYGYVSQLEENGFKINATDTPITDEETGRNIDWQLEIEKFIDKIYSGVQAGEGIILNPFMDKLVLQTPVGLLGRFTDSKFLDAYSSQACYDVLSSVIPMQKLGVVRTDPQTIINTQTPIFSAHLFIDEFEHAILLNTRFSSDPDSSIIFDQFLGSFMSSAFLSFVRQQRIDSKPTLDGFFLNGDNVLRNISSSIDALSHAYDAGQTFNEPKMAEHALALIGFKSKDYFNNIGISEQTQLDFWRGMINAKGTNLTVDAFTNYKQFLNSSVDEFWAYKLATYGDARERSFPEIKISPNDCSRQFTSIQFYSSSDNTYTALPLFIQVEAYDDSRWYSIDDLGTKLRFDAQEISETVIVSTDDFAVSPYVKLSNIYHTGDAFGPTPSAGTMVAADILKVPSAGTYTVSGYTWINKTKLSPVKLFDYSANSLVLQIGLWHPAIGIHAYEPLELVNITSSIDPAHYNYSTQTTNNPSYMTLKPWDDREVGRVWWDTSKLAYIPYHDALVFPNRETRHSRWGSLAEYASVDLYQWTESDFHPSEYNAQAALQEGDSTIDQSIRLSGKVGFTNYYQADRSVTIRPIAWSQTSSSNGLAHPAFGPATFVKVFNSNNALITDTGRLSALNIVNGYNFGGWDSLNNKPISECTIGTTVTYDIGNELLPGNPVLVLGSGINSMEINSIDNSSVFGTRIGKIKLIANNDTTNGIYKIRMSDTTGQFQDVTVSDWDNSDTIITIEFEQFGLKLTATKDSTTTFTASDLVTALTNSSNDIFVREAVDYTSIVQSSDTVFSNDPNDFNTIEHGWKVWQVPTQAQLSADLASPRNKWLPYLGDTRSITVTADVVTSMQDVSNTWTLRTGITIKRYDSSWSAWKKMTDTTQTLISDGTNSIEFTLNGETSIDTNRLSVYVNGIQLPPATIVISDNIVQVVNTPPEGTRVLMLYRAYRPTATELAFDPTTQDDFQIQTWYKVDYQYTQQTVRDSSGNITGIKYYFWVKDKTVPGVGKSMSLRQAAELLQYGDSTYMIFSRLISDDKSKSGTAYDSCAIAGLGTTVTKTNSYKLRFLRDFTLRDDPEELKLKNVHTEWALIRQHMPAKIPLQLWKLLTNAICGQDTAGNILPSQTRINYDAKYGTNTRYGFESDQIFVESQLALDSLINTVLNTSLTIELGSISLTDYITALNITSSTTAEELKETRFSTPEQSRATMNLIYSSARASQINEIFFSVLNDALANNYELTDLFKTSMITINSSTIIESQSSSEQTSEFY